MDDVKTETIGETIERWAFMVLGNFTTACFTQKFSVFDLLAAPQSFRGLVEDNAAHFIIPQWLPLQHCIFRMDNGSLFSRVKDLPLKKTTQAQPDGQNLLSIKLPTGIDASGLANLTYYPLFRFAHTGAIFDVGASPAALAVRIVEYASRRADLPHEHLPSDNGVYSLVFKANHQTYTFSALGTADRLNALILDLDGATLEINIEGHQLQLNSEMAPHLTQGIVDMLKGGRILRHCDVNIVEEAGVTYAQLAYRGA